MTFKTVSDPILKLMMGVTHTSGEIIAQIKMTETTKHNVYMLVEGVSDKKFYQAYIKSDCVIIVCGKKSTVVETVDSVYPKTEVYALGMIDDDFDTVMNIQHSSENVVATDTHDLETLMLSSSDVFKKVMEEYIAAETLTKLEHAMNMTLSDSLVERAVFFGKLRLISAMHDLNVAFESKLSPYKFIDRKSWSLNEGKLLSEFSQLSNWLKEDIICNMKSLPTSSIWSLIQGHDAMRILSIGLNGCLDSNLKSMDETKLSGLFRLAFTRTSFRQTGMCQKIYDWQNRNEVVVLKNENGVT